METRQAVVTKIRSRNDAGWTVLVTDNVTPTWVGVIEEDVQYGDTIQVSGEQTQHPKWGRQFKVEQVVSILPKSSDGKLSWLASTLPSIGPARAKLLVEAFGDALWDTLHLNLPGLAELPGIGAKKAAEISAAYIVSMASKEVLIHLVDLGLSVPDAKRVYGEFGARTREIIETDPYVLMDVSRISFEKADLVARTLGLSEADPRRALGYARNLLQKDASDGHCWADTSAILSTLQTICPDPEPVIRASKRFVEHEGRLWLKEYWDAEVDIANWINGE